MSSKLYKCISCGKELGTFTKKELTQAIKENKWKRYAGNEITCKRCNARYEMFKKTDDYKKIKEEIDNFLYGID